MIPFDELVRALDRYKRQQSGQAPAAAQTAPQGRDQRAYGVAEQSAEIALDDVETD